MPIMNSQMFVEKRRALIVQQEPLSPVVLLFVKGNISKCSYPDFRVIVPSDTKLKLTTVRMQHNYFAGVK